MLKILTIAAVIGAFAFALSFVGLSAWRSFHEQKHQTNQEPGTKKATENSGQPASPVVTKESPEQAIARYNLWLMIFTGVLAFVALIQIAFLLNADKTTAKAANAAQDSANVARQTLVIANRPWITVSQPIAVSPLTWDEKGARLTINWKIKNVGKSPAFDVSGEAEGFITNSKRFGIGTELEKFCKHLREKQIIRAAAGQHQEVLFPDEEISQGFGLLFPREQIEPTMKIGDKQMIAPVILVCIDYRSPVTDARHATGLAFLILKPGPDPNISMALIADETLAPAQFGLARSPFGSLAE
jgi:flagellar basal body-associated protein FliL